MTLDNTNQLFSIAVTNFTDKLDTADERWETTYSLLNSFYNENDSDSVQLVTTDQNSQLEPDCLQTSLSEPAGNQNVGLFVHSRAKMSC